MNHAEVLLLRAALSASADKQLICHLFSLANHDKLMDLASINKSQRPLAAALLDSLEPKLVPSEYIHIYEENLCRMQYLDSLLTRIFQRFAALNIKAALFEGSGVLYSTQLPLPYYGSNDIDILVSPRDSSLSRGVLESLGLSLDDRSNRAKVKRLEFVGRTPDGQKFWIDLATQPFERINLPLNCPDRTSLWLDRALPSLKNTHVHTLEPNDLFVQVSVHTSLHTYVRSPGIRLHMDVDRLASDLELNHHHIINELRSLALTRRSYFSLSLAKTLLCTTLPDLLISTLDPGPLRKSLFNLTIGRKLVPSPTETGLLLSKPTLLISELILAETHLSTSILKRLFDLLCSILLLIFLSPLLLLAAFLILIFDGPPVLFLQPRPGLHGLPFKIIKFRTMKHHSDANESPWYRTDASRLTPLGRFLRKYSIDELPELLNVIRGEMSLVGPRPLLMEYLTKYTANEARRHDARPGITGLAQVSGRQLIPFSKRLHLDLQYVDNWTFNLDVLILCKTFLSLFRKTIVINGQDLDSVDDLGLSSDRTRDSYENQ